MALNKNNYKFIFLVKPMKEGELSEREKELLRRTGKRYNIPDRDMLKDETLKQLDSVCEYLSQQEEKRFVPLEEIQEETGLNGENTRRAIGYLVRHRVIMEDTYTGNALEEPQWKYALWIDAMKIQEKRGLSDNLADF